MKITKEWLTEKEACRDGAKWVLEQKETEGIELVKKLIAEDRLDWAKWLIVRIMNYSEYTLYEIFAAEQVLHIWEKAYPDDHRPRAAIEAAKICRKNPTKENKKIAADAAADAAAAADADAYAYAAAANDAANATTYAANAAANAAYADANAAATYAATAAAYAANDADAADAKRKEMRIKILNHGLELLDI